MSDEQNTPTAAELEVMRSTVAALKAERDAAVAACTNVKAERDALTAKALEVDKAFGGLKAERDDLAAKHSSALKERDDFVAKHADTPTALEGLVNKPRERDVLEGLRAAFPGADATTVRGAFLAAVEDGKAQRYPEDPAKAVPELVELLKTVAPTLTRAAAAGGGPPPPRERQTTAPARAIWNIGNRTDNNSGN